ncbi:Os01g0369600 [Oryza sativa Japonica Group]|uniref:Os01g0369600 protein n=1 Tax=Oryza sativa subsp. japonica TaxID=39947 RepID=Q0JMR2_ORYSJ|nr:Os01g0369600 [Oryza sativa Japonica Group]|eukprot:NP_001043052.1 Os01g0369600 [Oryza sativa Japonica Group]
MVAALSNMMLCSMETKIGFSFMLTEAMNHPNTNLSMAIMHLFNSDSISYVIYISEITEIKLLCACVTKYLLFNFPSTHYSIHQ